MMLKTGISTDFPVSSLIMDWLNICKLPEINKWKKGLHMKIVLDHIGLITNEKRGMEKYVASMKVWITGPNDNPFHIEWLRFEEDSPVKGPITERNHIAYLVDDLEEASQGLKVLMEPFKAENFLKIGFYENKDGTVFELMQFLGINSDK
jgi:hypothetical protein